MTDGKEHGHWVGFDLGGTKMLATVFDEDFTPVGRKRRRTKGHEGVAAGMQRIVQTIRQALEDSEVSPDAVRGIGVGCPGPLELDKGIVLEAPNLGWENAPVKESLEKEFSCPAYILNDVDAGTYGEYCFGAGRKARCVLGVFPGTGIGGGCVYDGKILRGRTSSCMEIGHVPVIPDGPLCGCGQRGCLEAVASRLAISAAAAAAAFRGQAPQLRADAGTDLSDIRSSVLAESIHAGDRAVEQIVRQAAHYIGIAVAGVVHLLSPDVVVLGGGLAEAMPDIFVDEVQRSARQRVLDSYRETFKVKAAELGDDATALGAAAWAREEIEGAAFLETARAS